MTMRCAFSTIIFCLAGMCAAQAREWQVEDLPALSAAIEIASPGDVILLLPGDYGVLRIRERKFSPPLVIGAASEVDPPHFDAVAIAGATGVILRGVSISCAPCAGEAAPRLSISRARDVAIEDINVQADDTSVPAIAIRNSSALLLARARIVGGRQGVLLFDSDDIEIAGNRISAVAADGVAVRGTIGLTIRDNHFADFKIAPGVHPDAIQIWSRGAARASENAIISGNVIRRGTGDASQGIFISGPEFPSRNILIERNTIEQSMGQGIMVAHASDVIIRRNNVVAFNPATDRPAIDVRLPSGEISVTDNVAAAYRLADGVAAYGNLLSDGEDAATRTRR